MPGLVLLSQTIRVGKVPNISEEKFADLPPPTSEELWEKFEELWEKFAIAQTKKHMFCYQRTKSL